MHSTGEHLPHSDQPLQRLQSLPSQLLEGLACAEASVEIDSGKDILADLPDDRLYLIESGMLQARLDERPVFFLGEGDLLGMRQRLGFPECRYSCDTPVRLRPYERQAVLEHARTCAARQELLNQYLLGQIALLCDALARLRQPELRPTTGFLYFAAGEELIHQDDEADDVFIIVEGHAEAFVDGHRVGEVQKDEIFGAMAVFTGEQRSATVIAREPCTVMTIPKEQFVSLMHSNPRIAHSLIESLARRIRLLNQEVTQLRNA